MGPKKTLERIKYSFFWEGLRADVKKFCESCKECQLTRSVRIKDRSSSTPMARPELPFEVGNMDLIGPIDPPSLKGHKYILCLVDQHTRWGEAVPLTSLNAKSDSDLTKLERDINLVLEDIRNFALDHKLTFNPTKSMKLEKVQLSAALIITGLKNTCPRDIVFEVDLQPLSLRRRACLTKYYSKLRSPDSRNRTSSYFKD
ncbi:retrovirus-related Pol polyprotein from transposon opus [Trichonephila clavipes]|nr:retrovirus-related Pol polyprotein from transposon opus [Trichonephila clavipes]